MKFDKEPVTLVTEVTLPRGIHPLNIDTSNSKFDVNIINFLKNGGKSSQNSILEWCDNNAEAIHTLPEIVTSVTTVTRIGDYYILPSYPDTGVLYIINNFLSGQVIKKGNEVRIIQDE